MLIAFTIIHGANLRRTERQAFRWVQKYIGAFGGDSSKVTMYVSFLMSNRTIRHSHRIGSWGESSGAISAGLQLLANGGDTEGLFHGAFLQSLRYVIGLWVLYSKRKQSLIKVKSILQTISLRMDPFSHMTVPTLPIFLDTSIELIVRHE